MSRPSRNAATRSARCWRPGPTPAALDRDRYDAVTIASVADDEETLRTLLAAGASAKLVTSRYDGTALIAAAHLGHDGVVRQLIAAGAPLDHVNNLGWTALIEAVVLGDGGPRHQACVDALLSAGADRTIGDRSRRTPAAVGAGPWLRGDRRAAGATGDVAALRPPPAAGEIAASDQRRNESQATSRENAAKWPAPRSIMKAPSQAESAPVA